MAISPESMFGSGLHTQNHQFLDKKWPFPTESIFRTPNTQRFFFENVRSLPKGPTSTTTLRRRSCTQSVSDNDEDEDKEEEEEEKDERF